MTGLTVWKQSGRVERRGAKSSIGFVAITPDLDRILRSTDEAFCDTLHAVLDRDVHRARGVLKGSAARRRLTCAAADAVRSQTGVPAPQLNDRLQFVDDICRINALIDQLARRVVAEDEPATLTPAGRMEVAVLLDAGGRRLRQLLEGPIGPGMDPAYRGCGAALFEVADHGGRAASDTIALCGALAVVLLRASRHATRAA